MLLTITTTHRPATDLGFLLHKHPDRVQRFDQSYGTAHVFYPEAGEHRCTAALLLDVDPRRLLRARTGGHSPDFALAQYVNDRPYAASSLFAVALGDVFRTARRGRSADRPELAAARLPLTLSLPAVPARGGADQVHRLFDPLGWQVRAEPVALDPELAGWGDSPYVSLALTGEQRLSDALSHLYVLLPVLDGAKHYWVAEDEVDKLLRAGGSGGPDAPGDGGWLAAHPERGYIVRRYLSRRNRLFRAAIARLAEVEEAPEAAPDDTGDGGQASDPTTEDTPERDERHAAGGTATAAPDGAAPATDVTAVTAATDGTDATDGTEPAVTDAAARRAERGTSLAEARAGAVLAALRAEGARRVIDLGCGSGKLVTRLLDDPDVEHVAGADVAASAIEQAGRSLRLERMPERRRSRLTLFQGSVVYRDDRFAGYDGAVLMEVVEHIDPPRLPAMERVVFGYACPRVVVVTTPNVEYNVRYEGLAPGVARHADHRFEWTRAEFRDWGDGVAERYGYRVRYLPVGPEDPEVGPATQMGVFTR